MKPWLQLAVLAVACGIAGSAQAAPKPDDATFSVTPKPTASIRIEHRFASEPEVGQALEITLTITSGDALTGALLTLGADDPLALIEPLTAVALGALAAGESAEVVVTVLPLIEQTHYLNVTVAGETSGGQQVKSVAIAIRPPGRALRKAASDPAGKSDESVRSFGAIETVR
jgi:hypothetical protein